MAAWARLILLGGWILAEFPLCASPGRAARVASCPGRDHGQVLVRFLPSLSDAARARFCRGRGLTRISRLPSLEIDLLAGEGSAAEVIGELAGAPEVLWAEPNHRSRIALAAPDDPAYHELFGDLYVQWPVHALEALSAWEGYPSRYYDASDRPQLSPIVALIDTGIDPTHPDFMNPGAEGAEVALGGQLLLSAARSFLDGETAAGAAAVTDEHGHGTHLAGLIAGATNNGLTGGSGIAGLAYPARLLPIKVTGSNGVATHADIAQGIVYAADAGACVITIGLAGRTWSQCLQDAVDYAWRRDCFLVAPAGDADDLPMFPAACPHVFGVAAADSSGARAWYSGRGGHVALAAPGGDDAVGVYSVLPTYGCTLRTDVIGPAYGWSFGTSQAAAHAAAGAALWTGHAGLSSPGRGMAGDVWQALQRHAASMPGSTPGIWYDHCGYGSLALASLLSGEAGPGYPEGSIVGRVVVDGTPRVGASVSAARAGSGGVNTTLTQWPAGAFRVSNVATGVYLVTATVGGNTGVWEGARVQPGCDKPGVDFWLGEPAPDAALASADIPNAAVRGKPFAVSVTFSNTGEAVWERAKGYCLRATDAPLAWSPMEQVEMSASDVTRPGGSCTFAFCPTAPDAYGFYQVGWQMCQQGGNGRFGPPVNGVISVTSFLDVPADHWAVAAIEALVAADIVHGYDGDVYRPELPVSRGQMAVYISRALAGGDELVPPGAVPPTFPDVDQTHWAYRYVEYAYAAEVVRGYPDGLYWPDESVDRGQMAVFVARAMAGGESALADYTPPVTASFPDVPVGAWNYQYVEYIAGEGVAHGYPDNLYHSEYVCTRDQMAAYIARAFELQ